MTTEKGPVVEYPNHFTELSEHLGRQPTAAEEQIYGLIPEQRLKVSYSFVDEQTRISQNRALTLRFRVAHRKQPHTSEFHFASDNGSNYVLLGCISRLPPELDQRSAILPHRPIFFNPENIHTEEPALINHEPLHLNFSSTERPRWWIFAYSNPTQNGPEWREVLISVPDGGLVPIGEQYVL